MRVRLGVARGLCAADSAKGGRAKFRHAHARPKGPRSGAHTHGTRCATRREASAAKVTRREVPAADATRNKVSAPEAAKKGFTAQDGRAVQGAVRWGAFASPGPSHRVLFMQLAVCSLVLQLNFQCAAVPCRNDPFLRFFADGGDALCHLEAGCTAFGENPAQLL